MTVIGVNATNTSLLGVVWGEMDRNFSDKVYPFTISSGA